MNTFTFSMPDALRLAGVQYDNKTSINMNCCFCNETRRRLYLNLEKGVFYCHNCPAEGGVIDFVSQYFNVSKSNAYYMLKDNTLNGNTHAYQYEKLPKENNILLRKPKVSELSQIYNSLLDLCDLDSYHEQDLCKRGYSKEAIANRKFKSSPSESKAKAIVNILLKKGVRLEGVHGFYWSNGTWVLDTRFAGYYIPVREHTGEIRSLMIRRDGSLKKAKYLPLSSSHQSHNKGCGVSHVEGYIGNYHIAGSPKSDVLVFSEGLLKSDITEYLLNSYYPNTSFFVLGFPGAKSISSINILLERFYQNDYKYILDGYDKDKFTNPDVRTANNKLFHEVSLFYERKNISIPKVIKPTQEWFLENGVDDTMLLKLQLRGNKNE